jgi:hypothetical protein
MEPVSIPRLDRRHSRLDLQAKNKQERLKLTALQEELVEKEHAHLQQLNLSNPLQKQGTTSWAVRPAGS